jgi:hypothetical protein
MLGRGRSDEGQILALFKEGVKVGLLWGGEPDLESQKLFTAKFAM